MTENIIAPTEQEPVSSEEALNRLIEKYRGMVGDPARYGTLKMLELTQEKAGKVEVAVTGAGTVVGAIFEGIYLDRMYSDLVIPMSERMSKSTISNIILIASEFLAGVTVATVLSGLVGSTTANIIRRNVISKFEK